MSAQDRGPTPELEQGSLLSLIGTYLLPTQCCCLQHCTVCHVHRNAASSRGAICRVYCLHVQHWVCCHYRACPGQHLQANAQALPAARVRREDGPPPLRVLHHQGLHPAAQRVGGLVSRGWEAVSLQGAGILEYPDIDSSLCFSRCSNKCKRLEENRLTQWHTAVYQSLF